MPRKVTVNGVCVRPSGRPDMPWGVYNLGNFVHSYAKTEQKAKDDAEDTRKYLREHGYPIGDET